MVEAPDTKVAALIREGAALDTDIKLAQSRLKKIKEKLTKALDKGTYIDPKSMSSVTISVTPKYSDITPDDAKKALREKRLGKHFHECVKVSVTPLKRYLSDTEISKLREVVGHSERCSFKGGVAAPVTE